MAILSWGECVDRHLLAMRYSDLRGLPADATLLKTFHPDSTQALIVCFVCLGTIAQVSYASFKTNTRPIHSPLYSKLPLAWSPELEAAFKVSSREIIKQRELGVKSFPSLPTCLARDWNKFGTAPAMPLPCPSQRRRPQML